MTQTQPLAKDFANLLAVRNMMMSARVANDADDDRARVARWISGLSAPLACDMREEAGVRRFYPDVVRDPQPIFYLHGGGLVYYSTAVFAPFLSALCQQTGREIYAFDYPKAPETPMQDCVDALERQLAEWITPARPPALVGDSVGGLLALWFASGPFAGAFSSLHLIYPVLARHHDFASFDAFGQGYLLDAQTMRGFARHWLPWCDAQRFDPLDTGFAWRALPPCTVHTAGYDVLKDEGLAFVAKAREQGCSLTHYHHPAMPHDFCLYAGKLPSAQRAVDVIADALTNRTE
ncbi:alpha/beta hydrolase fold domain-containing protein [Cronobacter dublinensis]|uniref:alpha/beta hydrolase fold domain-containing protein n=1 Tax=Cronobacter dublinensis TaxID=413497 RepID=UPI00029BE022|nr:alpha/beta hydrolase [Cronobacter dublinensis]ELQ5997439.1 alpha/beta hydrolase [Cronobacter dublinensis]MDI6442771.1 alpha/beta hydrolase [Cronobacter dublinensis]NCH97672.1 alpha/beta hydrolase [Cronobacter dublinensis]CCJ86994.1 putative esterase [Cronobacter dublinensis 582]